MFVFTIVRLSLCDYLYLMMLDSIRGVFEGQFKAVFKTLASAACPVNLHHHGKDGGSMYVEIRPL